MAGRIAQGDLRVSEGEIQAVGGGPVTEAFRHMVHELRRLMSTIQQAASEIDPAKRDAAYKKVQQAIYEDNVEFPVYFRELIWGVRKRVTGFQGRTGGDTRVYYCGVT